MGSDELTFFVGDDALGISSRTCNTQVTISNRTTTMYTTIQLAKSIVLSSSMLVVNSRD